MKIRAALSLFLAACASSTGLTVQNDAATNDGHVTRLTKQVDLLMVIENTGSGNWMNYPLAAAGLGNFVESIFVPDDPSNSESQASDLRFGVVTADLGAPFTTCSQAMGDNAVLNPARFGEEQRGRFGSMGVRFVNSPLQCSPVDTYPRWLSVDRNESSYARFEADVACNVNLGNFGCALSQPLEALLRAGTREQSRATGLDDTDSFIRPGAILVLAVVTAIDDLSIRTCPASSAQATCNHAESALNFSSVAPCTSFDTTTELDRYHSPTTSGLGFLGFKPRHPERVLFTAFAGVPLGLGTRPNGSSPSWSILLGSPGERGANDFCARETESAFRGRDSFGAISMRVRDRDECNSASVPACRRIDPYRGSSACEAVPVFRAHPSRRLVEVARRFDESPLCAGQPCRNGMVFSICEDDYGPSMRALARRVRQRLWSAP